MVPSATSSIEPTPAEPMRLGDWLFSTDPQLRVWLQRTMLANLLYVALAALRLLGDAMGMISHQALLIQLSYDLMGVLLFYVAIRSKWSARFKDPALTLAQTTFALSSVVLSYGLIEAGRSGALQLLCLIMVVAMYRLSPRKIMWAGGLTVAMLILMLSLMAQWRPAGLDLEQEVMNIAMACVLLPILSVVAKQVSEMRLRQLKQGRELTQTLARLNQLATKDTLTGLTNRRHMVKLLEAESKRHDRGGHVFCVALLDVDWIKKINTGFGHPMGDEVLKSFAALAPEALRRFDVISRWGGEEFLILLPEATLGEARQWLDGLRTHLNAHWSFEAEGQCHPVNYSSGLTEFRLGEDLASTLSRADKALHAAKSNGRAQDQTA